MKTQDEGDSGRTPAAEGIALPRRCTLEGFSEEASRAAGARHLFAEALEGAPAGQDNTFGRWGSSGVAFVLCLHGVPPFMPVREQASCQLSRDDEWRT